MARVITYHIPATVRSRPASHFSLAAILSAPAVWVRRVRARRELMGLLSQPDYIIKDVGLQRSDITSEGLKRFWQV